MASKSLLSDTLMRAGSISDKTSLLNLVCARAREHSSTTATTRGSSELRKQMIRKIATTAESPNNFYEFLLCRRLW